MGDETKLMERTDIETSDSVLQSKLSVAEQLYQGPRAVSRCGAPGLLQLKPNRKTLAEIYDRTNEPCIVLSDDPVGTGKATMMKQSEHYRNFINQRTAESQSPKAPETNYLALWGHSTTIERSAMYVCKTIDRIFDTDISNKLGGSYYGKQRRGKWTTTI
jgi:hypothetical protein